MSHERVGHVRFPQIARVVGPAPNVAGHAAPDPRVTEMLKYLNGTAFEAHLGAVKEGPNPSREQNVGAYHAALAIKARFIDLFRTALPAPERDDPEGDTNG